MLTNSLKELKCWWWEQTTFNLIIKIECPSVEASVESHMWLMEHSLWKAEKLFFWLEFWFENVPNQVQLLLQLPLGEQSNPMCQALIVAKLAQINPISVSKSSSNDLIDCNLSAWGQIQIVRDSALMKKMSDTVFEWSCNSKQRNLLLSPLIIVFEESKLKADIQSKPCNEHCDVQGTPQPHFHFTQHPKADPLWDANLDDKKQRKSQNFRTQNLALLHEICRFQQACFARSITRVSVVHATFCTHDDCPVVNLHTRPHNRPWC